MSVFNNYSYACLSHVAQRLSVLYRSILLLTSVLMLFLLSFFVSRESVTCFGCDAVLWKPFNIIIKCGGLCLRRPDCHIIYQHCRVNQLKNIVF